MVTGVCPKCNGSGREEYNAGFLSRKCRQCGGTGKIQEVEASVTKITGLLFQLGGIRTDDSIDDLWWATKEAAIEKMEFPLTIELPCHSKMVFETEEDILNLLIQDIPCPCGNPNHIMVRFVDNREVANDDSRRTERDNKFSRSGDSGKSQLSKKSKTSKKARARVS